jgi:toxin ParE1/3/4
VVEITWSEIADENMQDIFDFIAKDSIRYAEKELQKIVERVEVLSTFPLSGKIVPDYGREDWRELVEGNYRIVYRILSEDSISIATIHHHSRLFK